MIVIIDDDTAILEMLRDAFSQGADVHVFKSGDLALPFIERNKELVQVILTDYAMPGMNGADLSLKIRDINPDIMIMMMSGFIDFESVEDLLKKRVIYQFITKPFNLTRLLGIIDTASKIYLKKSVL